MKRLHLILVLAAAIWAGPSMAAAVSNDPVAQSSWSARKQVVALPNEIRLAYVELGTPTGKPVLLLHGYTDTSRAWSVLAPQLLQHRLLILDQRGHGASDRPACCYTVTEMAHDALLFLDAMGVERASVAGHSLGSIVAQRMAADRPDRIDRIALLGSTALPALRREDWLWEQVMAMRQPVSANTEFLAQWSFGASPTPVDPEFVRHADAEAREVPPHVWRSVARELLDLPAGRYATDIRARVLILSGGADPLCPPEHHKSLVAAFPDAGTRVFEGLGHNFLAERPEEVGPVLAAFLAD